MADDLTRKSFDDAESRSGRTSDPQGEDLVRSTEDLQPVDLSAVVDDEAEELCAEPVADPTPDHADPEDMVVDDPHQLAEAERLAAQARSSRPVRRRAVPVEAAAAEPVPTVAAQPGASQDEVPAGDSQTGDQPAVTIPRPVRRPRSGSPSASAALEDPKPVRARAREAKQPVESGSRRTTPAAFVGQSADELRKVIWPTSSQLSQYFVVVLLFVLFIVAYVSLLDPAFGWVLLKFLGK